MDRLHGFLELKNKKAAKRAVSAIRIGLKVLEKDPELGRIVDGSRPEYRERVVEFGKRAYVALYRCDNTRVTILAIRHGREDKY